MYRLPGAFNSLRQLLIRQACYYLLCPDLDAIPGFCRTLGDPRKLGLKSVPRTRSDSRQAVAICFQRASNRLSSGRLASFRAAFTKNATEPALNGEV